ncbi:helix-turn-helix transcriptional regulator [Dokdonella fugitiva]|jgi:prophage regulatory protein|uniref:helix-turn-helix transcriptional regulator n=1 Tax=Dokdonella fugitiva TaxID=328517 RepID=UPI0015FCD386|nr:AlpA family transcriptional regulator [Dokdonella fugitiva]MBA8883755.1 putative DNA-binding transcriptional regulator AlpA [Dokdonella fugitiva]
MIAVNSSAAQPVLLRLPDVERMTGIKRSMIYRLEGEGRFPRRVKIGEHASAWVASEVWAWIATRIAARDAA